MTRHHQKPIIAPLLAASIALVTVLQASSTLAFVPPGSLIRVQRRQFWSTTWPPSYRTVSASCNTRLNAAAMVHVLKGGKTVETAAAGSIAQVLGKLFTGPAKANEIVSNISKIVHWRDVLLLSVLAFGLIPLVTRLQNSTSQTKQKDEDEAPTSTSTEKAAASFMDRLRIFLRLISEMSRVGLSVYAVDVMCIALTTVGFSFPSQWSLPQIYAKFAYTTWVVRTFLLYKKLALSRLLKVNSERKDHVTIVDRIVNVIIILLSSLFLLDWVPVRMGGKTMTGLLAIGSAGTLALSLASKGIITQLLAGMFLIFGDHIQRGDEVTLGANGSTTGILVRVGLLDSTLRGVDESVIHIPNTVLASQKVINKTRVSRCQVKQILRFQYKDVDKLPDVMQDIRTEIVASCPNLVTDGSRPFRVAWTSYCEDHLEVTVDTRFKNISPISDAFYVNRQNMLMAIQRAIDKHNVQLAPMYTYVDLTTGEEKLRRGPPPPPSPPPPRSA